MRRSLPFLALFVLCLLASGAEAAPSAAPPPLAYSVVRVDTEMGTATGQACGVVIPTGVLTCWHVVSDATAVEVTGHDGRRLRGKSWSRVSDRIDAALILFDKALPWPALRVARSLPAPGARVVSVGAWGRALDENRMQESWGYVFAAATLKMGGAPSDWLTTSIACLPGMSGSPLVHGRGVIGLASRLGVVQYGPLAVLPETLYANVATFKRFPAPVVKVAPPRAPIVYAPAPT